MGNGAGRKAGEVFLVSLDNGRAERRIDLDGRRPGVLHMKFWVEYMDRNEFLAMAWMRLAWYQRFGEGETW